MPQTKEWKEKQIKYCECGGYVSATQLGGWEKCVHCLLPKNEDIKTDWKIEFEKIFPHYDGNDGNFACEGGDKCDCAGKDVKKFIDSLLHSELDRRDDLIISKLNETMSLFDYEHERNAIRTCIDVIQSLKEEKV